MPSVLGMAPDMAKIVVARYGGVCMVIVLFPSLLLLFLSPYNIDY
jgi:hypothetical protein